MAARLSAMEREVLAKVMAWYDAQQRGALAVPEADAVFSACERLAVSRDGRKQPAADEAAL